MKNASTYFLLFLFACAIFSSCKKDKPVENPVPEITFISATPTNIKEYQDSLTLKFSYKDGDGDLGENSPDVKNLFITDNRIGIVYPFRIKQLAPDGANIAIQGELNAVIKNVAITDSSTSQNVTFSIYVVDRAGNKSNVLGSGVITIVK